MIMYDFRGTELKVGDNIILWCGCANLERGKILKILDGRAKVQIGTDHVLTKYKHGECMVKDFQPA